MRPLETLEQIREAVRPILEPTGVAFAVLFGSAAAGRAGAASDLDIGVAGNGPGLPVCDALDLAVTLERVLGREVDLVDLGSATPLLRREAARGRRLYERIPGTFADFVARAVLEFDDVRPHLLRGGRALLRAGRRAS
ncbi:MAG: nucleotidyltransferase domain-containing protein [Deltaproteobacteria bacterium]|nr:nucleotidyltransferase domain-containing protein [Deltaproteobacteria bacterium]